MAVAPGETGVRLLERESELPAIDAATAAAHEGSRWSQPPWSSSSPWRRRERRSGPRAQSAALAVRTATQSISTTAPSASSEQPTVMRAGGAPAKKLV